MLLYPNAKINIGLNIVKKLNNGYHDIESCFCPVSLYDIIEIKQGEKDHLSFSGIKIDGEISNNIIVKALKIFNCNKKFRIHLHKNIPIGAGLGGGSSNAATLLIALRYFYNRTTKSKKISFNDIQKLSHNIGSDVPACLFRRSLNVSGSGEKIKPLSPVKLFSKK